jgi:tetratricopeptide (TPR) repeat protein
MGVRRGRSTQLRTACIELHRDRGRALGRGVPAVRRRVRREPRSDDRVLRGEGGVLPQPARRGLAELAGSLLHGPRAADAEYLLGSSALARDQADAARGHLERASEMHGEARDFHAQARDAYQLAGLWFGQGEYREALDALAALRAAASEVRDHRMEVYAELASTDIHRAIGDRLRAEQAVARAIANAQHPDDRLYARFKQATMQLDVGDLGPARDGFEHVVDLAARAGAAQAPFLGAAQANLAFLDRKQGRPAESLARIERHRHELDEVTFLVGHGLALAELGRLAEARADLRRAEALDPPDERAWWVPYQAALVETKAGDTAAQITPIQRTITKITHQTAAPTVPR